MYYSQALSNYSKALSSPKYSPLPPEEERRLLEKYCVQGDGKAFIRLVESYLRFVIYVLNDYKIPEGINIMDVIQEGNIGLMESIRKFDYTRSSRISTYAIYWIRFYITKYIRPNTNSVSVIYYSCPIHGETVVSNNPCKCRECGKELIPVRQSIFSPYEKVDHEIPGFKEFPDQEQAARDISKFISESSLSDREKLILNLFFGIQPPYQPKTLQEIGSILHLNFERVRQLREGALDVLRRDKSKILDFVSV